MYRYIPEHVLENKVLGLDMFSTSSNFYSAVRRPSGPLEDVYNKVHRVADEQRNAWLANRDLDMQLRRLQENKIKFTHEDNEYKKSILTPKQLFTNGKFLICFILGALATFWIPCFFWVGPLIGLLIGRNKVWKATPEYRELVDKKFRETAMQKNAAVRNAQNNLDNARVRVAQAIQDLNTISPERWSEFVAYSTNQVQMYYDRKAYA